MSLLFGICLNDSAGICREAGSSASDRNRSHASARENGEGFDIGACLASIFREHISAVDGDRRPSLPSCSSYSVLAFKKHGFFIGWVMTVHRLTHQGDEGSVSPLKVDNGQVKILDPVENKLTVQRFEKIIGSSGRGGVFLKGRNPNSPELLSRPLGLK